MNTIQNQLNMINGVETITKAYLIQMLKFNYVSPYFNYIKITPKCQTLKILIYDQHKFLISLDNISSLDPYTILKIRDIILGQYHKTWDQEISKYKYLRDIYFVDSLAFGILHIHNPKGPRQSNILIINID